jgi:dTMP kinase
LDSTIVYQGYGRGLNIDFIRSVGRIATDNIEPDLTFVLQISIAESYRRRSIRNNNNSGVSDRIEESGNDFFLKVESGYRDLAMQEPDRVKIIDAERSPETVAGNIWKYIDELLSKKMEKS